ncbi:MAG: selenide, water dikinase SelD [Proteobacteria bacterium]|nr:selenide, water dikinase SelD [Pseudomonadota bacterium]
MRDEHVEQPGGCSRKLPQQLLRELLHHAALSADAPALGPVGRVEDMGDSHLVRLTEPTQTLLATSDLLFPVSSDGQLFGSIAATHALSDIYASLGTPLFVSVTIAGPQALLVSEYASASLAGLQETVRRAGAVVAGGHTVENRDAFLSVAVTGRALDDFVPVVPSVGDRVLLSKPLGTGLALAALKMGLVSEDEITSAYSQMTTLNREAAAALREALEAAPGSIRAVTDVSGFGLLGGLKLISGDTTVRIFSEDLPVIDNVDLFVQEQSWSALADANLRDTDPFVSYIASESDKRVTVLLNDPQTSGGLLAIVAPSAAEHLESDSANSFSDIGEVCGIDQEFTAIIGRRGVR